jgi:hypothetical protein
MPDDLVPIASYDSAPEAHAARGRLEAAGIASQVSGEAAATTLSLVGTALGGVKLLVWKSDFDRAAAILFPDDAGDESHTPQQRPRKRWKCPRCKERNEPEFDLCWSCGAEYEPPPPKTQAESVASPAPSAVAPEQAVSFSDEDATEDDTQGGIPGEQADNPYAAGRYPAAASAAASRARQTHSPLPSETDAVVVRAWRASVIGLVFCPVVLHVYSLWLLLCVALGSSRINPATRPWFYAALAVDLAVMFFVWLGCWFGGLGA